MGLAVHNMSLAGRTVPSGQPAMSAPSRRRFSIVPRAVSFLLPGAHISVGAEARAGLLEAQQTQEPARFVDDREPAPLFLPHSSVDCCKGRVGGDNAPGERAERARVRVRETAFEVCALDDGDQPAVVVDDQRSVHVIVGEQPVEIAS